MRATSGIHRKSQWKPVDLACAVNGDEIVVRTKLARDPESIAVCIAESVSHALLAACGFRVADGYCVTIGPEFAADLSAQYGFDPPVRSGRHWGTRYMQVDVQEVTFQPHMVDDLARPGELFDLFLADVVLGNPDRCTFGNVLLAHRPGGNHFDLLPIDQSEAFFHPNGMLNPATLRTKFDQMGAEMLSGTERALVSGGTAMVEGGFARLAASHGRVGGFVDQASGEWFDAASVDPALLVEFLEHRIGALEILANKAHWLGLVQAAGGGYVLDFGR